MAKKVLILGAGAAGLAAARSLRQAGMPFHILEARDRIGGRAHSLLKNDIAIEYGAEFIHGAHPEVLSLLTKTSNSFVEVSENRLIFKNSKLQEAPEFAEDLERVSSKMNPRLKADRSIADFIKRHENDFSKTALGIFQSYIEGFQAADIHIAGERGLAQMEKDAEPELNGVSQFRPEGGYGRVMQLLAEDFRLRSDELSYKMEVEEIHWNKDFIEVRGKNLSKKTQFHRRADYVINTLPLNVLKNSIKVLPEIPAYQRALFSIPMGHLQRITFEFKSAFWQELSTKPVSFFHTGPGCDFPTWWTQNPKRNHYLIAWQGGPRALEMSSWTVQEKFEAALKTLAMVSGRRLSFLKSQLISHHHFDWTLDPYCQGAYTYPGIDSSPRRLHRAFGKRLFIAGEATAEGTDIGTVHGAMKSGERAAKKILSMMKLK